VRKTILIVDDSLFMRQVLKNMLSSQYDILEADSGATGEKQIKEKQPDLTLLDIVMPDGEEEGIKLLKKVMKVNPKLKIVMITAVAQDTIIAECRKYGASDYIVKPFDEGEVLGKVQQCLA
jgi:two-component system chemotaxis response regulator CheY